MLVLNQNYEPLNVCDVTRAFRLLFVEKAEVIEYDHHEIRTPRTEFRAPSVIRLQHHIKRPRPRVRLSRREVFARDRHMCQYCGRQTHDLTLDHVDAAPSRRRAHLGQPRGRVQGVQPPQGRQDTRGGPHAPDPRAVRAAQRRLHAVHAVPRGRAQRGVADLPVPGPQLTASTGRPVAIAGAIPAAVRGPRPLGERPRGLRRRRSVRDSPLVDAGRLGPRDGRAARTRPRVVSRPPSTRTGSARSLSGDATQFTTFRTDHDYADFRRPHWVEFGDTIESDLARRDFTVNAMAWGARPAARAGVLDPSAGWPTSTPGSLRAVGDPGCASMRTRCGLFGPSGWLRSSVSPSSRRRSPGSRRAPRWSAPVGRANRHRARQAARAPLRRSGCDSSATPAARAIRPDLAAQRGVPQNKVPGRTCGNIPWSLDAAPGSRPIVRLAALLHDIGKPSTFADGHFVGHDVEGAKLADELLSSWPRPARHRAGEWSASTCSATCRTGRRRRAPLHRPLAASGRRAG